MKATSNGGFYFFIKALTLHKIIKMLFSLIIPVYNRPDEIDELLESLCRQTYKGEFETVIVEDGSVLPCSEVIKKHSEKLFISYYFKSNSGPGDSRNFGMDNARGDYFIILDSDCILPPDYLENIHNNLSAQFTDCFGGPDNALPSFSNVQKAINFAMTSVITTGGVRGASEKISKFQPRSFNMGLSKNAYIATGGFGNIHPGEDPDLSIRLWKLGYKTTLFTNAFVYHKRRIDWQKFYVQVNKFGKARPILDLWHPEYKKITFLFPSLFITGFTLSVVFMLAGVFFPIYLYLLYFLAVFLLSIAKDNNLVIGFFSVAAVFIQFYGYGMGYIRSLIAVHLLKNKPETAFPELFFKS